jgi:hypothetical protein
MSTISPRAQNPKLDAQIYAIQAYFIGKPENDSKKHPAQSIERGSLE